MQNELIVHSSFHAPSIKWHVYYDDNGKIIACSPSVISELLHYKTLNISAELGSRIIAGQQSTENLRVIQNGGIARIVEAEQVQKTTQIVQQSRSGPIGFKRIDGQRDDDHYVIGLTILPDKLIFKSNSINRTQFLSEIKTGSIQSHITIFFTKKNDPSWLIAQVRVPLQQIFEDDLYLTPLDSSEFGSYSVFADGLAEGFRLFEGDANDVIGDRLNFLDFINSFSSNRTHTFVTNKTNAQTLFEVSLTNYHFRVVIRPQYRDMLVRYLERNDAKTHITFSILDPSVPFFAPQTVRIALSDLIWSDSDHLVKPLLNPLPPKLAVDVNNADKFINFVKTPEERLNELLEAIKEPTQQTLIEGNNIDPIVTIQTTRSKIIFKMNSNFKPLLKDLQPKMIQIMLMGKTVQTMDLNINDLVEQDLEFDLQVVKPMIYIDIKDPDQYFQINKR